MDWAATGGFLTGLAGLLTALGVWWRNHGTQRVSETDQIIRGLHGVAEELRLHANSLLDRARQAELDLEECEGERRSNRRRIDDLERTVEKQQRVIDEQAVRIGQLERALHG